MKVSDTNGAQFSITVKDHKNMVEGKYPVRPIASVHGTGVDKIDWLLQGILVQTMEKCKYHISDRAKILKEMEAHKNTKDLEVISLDVVNLYPSIPLKEGLIWVLQKTKKHAEEIDWGLLNYEWLHKMLDFTCNNYIVEFNGKLYKQIAGVPMGARFAPPFSIIVMDHIENEALTLLNDTNIKFYGRYIDDILMVRTKGGPTTNTVRDVFNSVNESIQFTIEESQNNQLAFLDIKIVTDEEGIKTRWYQKELHSGNMLRYDSFIPRNTKFNTAVNMFMRVMDSCSTDAYAEEDLNKIWNQFITNRFPVEVLRTARHKAARKQTQPRKVGNRREWLDNNKVLIKIPFISEACNDKIKRITDGSGLGFMTVNDRAMKITNIAKPVTNKRNKNCNCKWCKMMTKGCCKDTVAIYKATCNNCGHFYIGKTNNQMGNRIREHLNKNPNNNSAIAKHKREKCNGGFTFETIERNHNYLVNDMRELMIIKQQKPQLNQQTDFDII